MRESGHSRAAADGRRPLLSGSAEFFEPRACGFAGFGRSSHHYNCGRADNRQGSPESFGEAIDRHCLAGRRCPEHITPDFHHSPSFAQFIRHVGVHQFTPRLDWGPIMRGTVLRLLLVLLAVGGTLVFTEGLLRWSGWVPVQGVMTVDEGEFQRYPGLFVPGQAILASPGTRFPHRVTIDSLGYRGLQAVARIKPTGEFRVLYAGDSFTFGHNVHDEETLPAQLEGILQARCPGSRVVNAGVSGFTILGQAEQVRRGLVLDPDMVVVMFYENDLEELVHVRFWDQLAMNRRVKSRFPLSVAYRLLRQSALWRLGLRSTMTLRQRLGARMAGAPAPERAADSGALGGPAIGGHAEYRERLGDLLEETRANGVPLLYVAFPSPSSTASSVPEEPFRWAVATARELGVPTLDLHGPLRASGRSVEELYLVPDDYHPSPAGHTVAAELVADFLYREAAGEMCPD